MAFILGLSLLGIFQAQAQLLPPILPNIFGVDDRVEALISQAPYRGVVRVVSQQGDRQGRCTGTLVGPDLVLTAQHCIRAVYDFTEERLTGGLVVQAMARGVFFALELNATVAARGEWTADAQPSVEDWVLLRLANGRMARFGVLEVRDELSANAPQPSLDLRVPGYGSGSAAGSDVMTVGPACSVRRLRGNGTFYHDCDTTRGASGAPVLRCPATGACYVVGISVGAFRGDSATSLTLPEYSDEFANVGIAAAKFVDELMRLR